MEDQLVKVARDLTDTEVRVMSGCVAGLTSHDISIAQELSRADVVKIIKTRGKDSQSYMRNLLTARNQVQQSVPASRPGPNNCHVKPVIGGGDALARADRERKRANAAVTRTPDPSSTQVDAGREVRQAVTSVTHRDVAAAASAGLAAAAAGGKPGEASKVTTGKALAKQAPSKVASASASAPQAAMKAIAGRPHGDTAADLSIGTPPLGAVLVDPASDVPIEELIAAAEASTNPKVQQRAQELRDGVVQLRAALLVEAKASQIQARINELDAQIVELRTQRDQLRDELERLLAGDVVVSASSGTVRKQAPDSDDPGEASDATVRKWAVGAGFEVPGHGSVPSGVRAAYNRQHRSPVTGRIA